MRLIGVIPARYRSRRFPGKALVHVADKPMIQWVYEAASRASVLADLVVATDDRRIFDAVTAFGGRAEMTGSEHSSGTDRVAEIAVRLEADGYVNIQGDEPLISPTVVDAVGGALREGDTEIATARFPIVDHREISNPHVVKVVCDAQGRALYFSRAPIPHAGRGPATFFKHIGIYAYRRSLLLRLKDLKPSPLEGAEGLEQLRFLHNGVAIQVVISDQDSLGVDIPEDIERVRPLLKNRRQKTPIRGG